MSKPKQEDPGQFSHAARLLVLFAMFIIIVAGLKAAAPLLVPLLLAIFLALLCLPALNWFTSKRVPGWLSVTLLFAGIFLVGSVLLTIVGGSVEQLRGNLGQYKQTWEAKEQRAKDWVREKLPGKFPEEEEKPDKPSKLDDFFDEDRLFSLATAAIGQFGSVVGNLIMVLLLFVFLLSELQSLPAKISAIRPEGAEETGQFNRIVHDVNRYVGIKTIVSFATGICAGITCAAVGVDFPVLWGLIAFLMNFIPNIGSFMAAIPPLLLTVVQPGLGLSEAIIVASAYAGINFIIGNVIEPRMMGKSLDLSTLVVFVSLVFWGWVFGAVGMLLSVPLTMVIKIACETSPTTRPIAILLGSGEGLTEGG